MMSQAPVLALNLGGLQAPASTGTEMEYVIGRTDLLFSARSILRNVRFVSFT